MALPAAARARHGGVLLHPSSLPGPGPVGEIGPYAFAFIDWLAHAGMDTWQVLPLHPVGPGQSPYASPSAFAADPRLISLEALIADGWLDPAPLPFGSERVDPEAIERWKLPLLRDAARRAAPSAECRAWAAAEGDWLAEWSSYAALAAHHGDGWWRWPAGHGDRVELGRARAALADEVAIAEGLQYLFHLQWARVRAHARERGVRLVGDIPIFVSGDGCDTWAHRRLFRLRPDGRPDPVAGVPPDYFAPGGQRWGNPTYAWPEHAATGYAWWRARLRRELALVDVVRLDHFRGFLANWAIPADQDDARAGAWEAGPGRPLFDALRDDLGDLPLIAEDLGDVTPDVAELRDALGLPGMKVLQFAFGGREEEWGRHPFLPHNFGHDRWVVYSGTHDNDTAVGWYASTDPVVRHRARTYCGRDGSDPAWMLLREAWASVAGTAIAPMQDVLRAGPEARLNTPGEADGNWGWRLLDLPWDACGWLAQLNATYARGVNGTASRA